MSQPSGWTQPTGPGESAAPAPSPSPYGPPPTGQVPRPPSGWPPAGPPPAGPPPSWGPTQPAAPWGPSAPPSAWAPSGPTPVWTGTGQAKPGIIPLRPLTFGEILDGSFQLVRSNPRTMIGFSAAVLGVSAVVALVPQAAFQSSFSSLLFGSTGDPYADQFGGSTTGLSEAMTDPVAVGSLLGTIVVSLLTGLVGVALLVMLVIASSAAVLGDKPSLGVLWRQARGRLLRAVGLYFLLTLGAMFVIFGPLFPGIGLLIVDQTVVGALMLMLGVLAIPVLLAWLGPRVFAAWPILVLERQGVFASLARSWRLVRGNYWRTLGISTAAMVIAYLGISLISTPFVLVGLATQYLMDNPEGTDFVANLVVGAIGSVGQTIAGAVFVPWLFAAITLQYLDLRMRSEGLDFALLRGTARTPGPVS